MSEAYVKFGRLRMAIQDPVAQRILAVGAVAIVASIILRRGNIELFLEAAKEASKISANTAVKVIDNGYQ